jgi:peptidoglycan/LPS O-acetylase OafA/YrhL
MLLWDAIGSPTSTAGQIMGVSKGAIQEMALSYLSYWRDIPAGARTAIATLILGWLLHYSVYFYNFPADLSDRTVLLQLAVGIGICYSVATGRRWARMLCVFFNIGIIALYGLYSFALIQSEELEWGSLTALIVATFVISTLFLLRRDTGRYFNPAPPSVSAGR